MSTIITAPEAALIASLLRRKVDLLEHLLACQVANLPEGDASWADTEEDLSVAREALEKMEAIR